MKTKIIIAFSILLSAQFANSQSITGKVLSRVLASDNFENQPDWSQCSSLNNQLGGTSNYNWYNWGGQLAWPGVSAIGGNKGMGVVWGGVIPLTGFVFDADSTYQIDCLIHPTGGNDGSWNNYSGIHIYATNNTDIWQNSGVRVRIQNGETGTGFGNPSTLLAEWWSGANKDYANSTVKDFSTTPAVYSIDGTPGANYWIPLKLVLKGDGTLAKPLIIDYYLKNSFVGTTSFDNLSTLGDKTIGFVRFGNSNDHAAFDNFVLSTLKTSLTIALSASMNVSTLGDLSNTDLTVNSGYELTLNQATTTVKSLTVAPGGKLTIGSNALTAINGVTLQSDPTGTATLMDSYAVPTINATVKQYVEAGRNWYMSIPLASGASSLLNRGTSVVCFDEPSGNWIAPAAGTLNKMRGYVQVATSTPSVTGTTGTVDFTGVVNTGAHSITLSRTAGKTGFNLVGNPYPSYLDWNAVTKTNVSNTMWYRTKEGSVYKFYTYIANSGAGVGSPVTVTNKIPPMQAFWVRVNTEGTGSIAVDNDMRSHNDVAGNIMKAPKQSSQQLIRLQVSNGTNTDETVLYFNTNASDAFDQYDAQKRSNDEPSVPEIYTQVGNEQLVINGMNSVKYNTEIPIGFSTLTAAKNNSLSISANEISNFEAGVRLILIDKLNPTVENELTNGAVYNFSAPVTTPTTNRFSLVFRAPGVATGIDNAAKLNAQIFVNANNQITIIAPEKSNYAIYNSMGQKVNEGVTTTNRTVVNGINNSGVYVIRVCENGRINSTCIILNGK